MAVFADRDEAGGRLAGAVAKLAPADPIVLALPRGGVPVARAVAERLRAPLDLLIVRKLGVPRHPEYAFGALGENSAIVVDTDVVRAVRLSDHELTQVVTAETAEIKRRVERYRRGRPLMSVAGRTAIIVDDGLATGSTMAAAIKVVRELGPARVVVAVPVGSPDAVNRIGAMVDAIVCLDAPASFRAVGQFYRDFRQLSDREVTDVIGRRPPPAVEPAEPESLVSEVDTDVVIPAGPVLLGGQLVMPPGAEGVVIFAHGSGSSRFSPRNQFVARTLNRAGLGTLLFDLLTEDESTNRANVFDIELLASRLVAATRWLRGLPQTASARIGYFGASTGAGAALVAAASIPEEISSVVSRGGRPDLAGPALGLVRAPTLLIVGDRDDQVIELNRMAQRQLMAPNQLILVPGATHLFDEPGTLEQAASLATDHFRATLGPGAHS